MKTKLGLLLCVFHGAFSFGSPEPDCTVNGTLAGCSWACPETCKAKNINLDCFLICGGPCECKYEYIIDTSIPACVQRADCPAGVVQSQTEREVVRNFPHFSAFS